MQTNMADQREKLKDLFETTLNISGQEREEFLLGINAQDPPVCAQLKRIIGRHESSGALYGVR